MSAILHSPGFFDFLKPIANLASFIPGPVGIVGKIISGALAGGEIAGSVGELVQAPSRSVGTSFPDERDPIQSDTFYEEEDEEEYEEEPEEEAYAAPGGRGVSVNVPGRTGYHFSGTAFGPTNVQGMRSVAPSYERGGGDRS